MKNSTWRKPKVAVIPMGMEINCYTVAAPSR